MNALIGGTLLGVLLGAIVGNGTGIVGGLIEGVSGYWVFVVLGGLIGCLSGEIVRLRKGAS